MPITEVLTTAVVFSAIVMVFKIIADYKTKKNLIDKGLVDEKIKFLYNHSNRPLTDIKWGMILVGIGLAIFANQYLQVSEESMLGLMFIFAGSAFLIYYAISKKSNETK